MGARKLNMAARKMVPLRPSALLTGSEIHPALKCDGQLWFRSWGKNRQVTYKKAMAIYGQELMNPTIQVFLSHVPAASQGPPDVSGMPKKSGKERLAPLEPV